MTDYDVTGGKEKTEDPVRLRECLNALSVACGHDVFRVETTVQDKGIVVRMTCSKEASEEVIASFIVAELARYMGLKKASK